jgi:hypothetical protein
MSWLASAWSFCNARLAAPWQRDEVGAVLFPDRLIIARVGGAGRRRLKHKEIIGLAPGAPGAPDWQPALEALARRVMAGGLAGANVNLVLSSHFVHYVLVPWNELLKSEEDQLAFARQRLIAVHGSAADGWSLKLSQSGPRQSRLACGVPQTLIDAVQEVMAPLGGGYRSLQPHLMASFNRWRDRLNAQPGWFVAAEPGLACLALLRDGQWQSMRTFRIGSSWPTQLQRVLDREQFLIDSPVDCQRVLVFAPELPAVEVPAAGDWQIEHLQPTLLPDMAAGADARFAIAVGV